MTLNLFPSVNPFRFQRAVSNFVFAVVKGRFLEILIILLIEHMLHPIQPPSDSSMSEDAGIKPRTVVALALALSPLG